MTPEAKRGAIPYGMTPQRTADPTAAPIVREIFARVAHGDPFSVIARDLDARGVRAPRAEWSRTTVRVIARNYAYVRARIVTEGQWRACEQLRARATAPADARTLLTGIAESACGARMKSSRERYTCARDGCVSVLRADADARVRDMICAHARAFRTDCAHGERALALRACETDANARALWDALSLSGKRAQLRECARITVRAPGVRAPRAETRARAEHVARQLAASLWLADGARWGGVPV